MQHTPPAAPTILAPERFTLGKYEVIQRLATGGMAEIFLARVVAGGGISGFEKYVVLKRMLPQLQGQEEFVSTRGSGAQ